LTRQPAKALKEEILQGITASLPRGSFQKHPYFPDLLRQPDLLAVPETGKLLAVFIYEMAEQITWRNVLACVEDVFEVKLSVGLFTVVIGVAANRFERSHADDDKAQLLRNTFDLFHLEDGRQTETLQESVASVIARPSEHAGLTEFLNYERDLVHSALEGFSEERYRELVVVEQDSLFKEVRSKSGVAESLSQATGLPIIRDVLIRNVKGELADLRQHYSFEFDYGIEGRPNVAIEVLRSGRYGSRDKIRYLMIKARLLRYEFSEGRLRPSHRRAKLILVVDGNIAGPDHDPFRYVRSLLSVGWELVRADRLNAVEGLLANENV
jgi:hypothetical protein